MIVLVYAGTRVFNNYSQILRIGIDLLGFVIVQNSDLYFDGAKGSKLDSIVQQYQYGLLNSFFILEDHKVFIKSLELTIE